MENEMNLTNEDNEDKVEILEIEKKFAYLKDLTYEELSEEYKKMSAEYNSLYEKSYFMLDDVYKQYSIDIEKAPDPQNFDLVIVLETEGRFASRILRKAWEQRQQKSPPMFFLDFHRFHKFDLDKSQENSQLHLQLSKNDIKSVVETEFPGLVEIVKNGGKRILLFDSSVVTMNTIRYAWEFMHNALGGDISIKSFAPFTNGNKLFGLNATHLPPVEEKRITLRGRINPQYNLARSNIENICRYSIESAAELYELLSSKDMEQPERKERSTRLMEELIEKGFIFKKRAADAYLSHLAESDQNIFSSDELKRLSLLIQQKRLEIDKRKNEMMYFFNKWRELPSYLAHHGVK